MTSSTRKRRGAERRGRRAETAAAIWLQLQGWRILDRRARTGAGELDLVALRGRTLAFIEVKERRSLGAGLEAVSARQRDRLLRAGALWRASHPAFETLEPRFDLIVIAPWRLPVRLKGAFEAEHAHTQSLL